MKLDVRNAICSAFVFGGLLPFCNGCAVHNVKAAGALIGAPSLQFQSHAPISIDVRGLCDDGAPALEVVVSNLDGVEHDFDIRAEPWAINAGGIVASAIDYAGRELETRPPSLSNPISGAVLKVGESVVERYLLEWGFIGADSDSFRRQISVDWEYYGRLGGRVKYVGGELRNL